MNRRNPIALIILTVASCALSLSAATATLPPGTKLRVRITGRLSSDTAKPGDTFSGTIAQSIVINGKTLFDKGTDVKGEVILANRSGRLSSPGELQLVLTSVSGGWFRSYPLTVQPLTITGGSHTKSNIAKIGGDAAGGAGVRGLAPGGQQATL